MTHPHREDTCCEKCYHDIENGVVFAIFQCEDCPCHSPKEEVQESREGDWEEEFDTEFPSYLRITNGEYYDLRENIHAFIRGTIQEARTLALQEAAGIVRGQKRECKYCDPAHPHGDCYPANGNEALEDAAREIEVRIVRDTLPEEVARELDKLSDKK